MTKVAEKIVNNPMIGRKSYLLYLTKIPQMILVYIAYSFLSRKLGPAGLGVVGYIYGIIKIFSSITFLGSNVAHSKILPGAKEPKKAIGTYRSIITVLSFVSIGGLIIYYFFVGFDSLNAKYIFLILVADFIIRQVVNIIRNTFKAQTKIALSQIPETTGTTMGAISQIILSLSFINVIIYAFTFVFNSLIDLIVSLYYFRFSSWGKFSKKYLKKYLKIMIPIIPFAIAVTAATGLNAPIINYFWNTTEVGYFVLPQKIIKSFTLILTSMATVLLPTLSLLRKKHQTEKYNQTINIFDRFLIIGFGFISISIFSYAEPIMRLVGGTEFIPSANVIKALAVYLFFFAANRLYVQVLYSLNEIKYASLVATIGHVLSIVISLLIVPTNLFGYNLPGWGAVGMAIALAFSSLFNFITLRAKLEKIIQFIDYRVYLKYALSLMIIYGYFYGSSNFFKNDWLLIVNWIIGGGIYFTILYLLKEIGPKELRMVKSVVSPKKMSNYIKKETGNN